jgi:hypothetical protein
VAGTLGYRHPFISGAEWYSTLEKWRNRQGVSTAQIEDWSRRCQEWVIPSDDMYGAEVRLAEKREGRNKSVIAVAMREVFDRKNPTKDLKLFSTNMSEPYTYVAIPRKEYIGPKVLFSESEKAKDHRRKAVEDELLKNCEPLTIGQRCADWFLMKSMLVSGTTAGKIVGGYTMFSPEPTGEELQHLLTGCLSSWFGRHKNSANMVKGSLNEDPTMEKLLSSENFIIDIFDVGLVALIIHCLVKYNYYFGCIYCKPILFFT